ncbi:hypothetical protein BAG01nite_10680 [Brevibacillus agri]|uniref:Uncharacterized protein n=1 Tax=Brevibacillus agri TaxID=51101 RepID=A0A3M8AVX9_9BACL|nr:MULTISPECIES: hypothetical protein [Brevibacillus]ELK41110.1 hypothetical protein D478_15819 [Brevibacillus agri BAB-2500]MBG9564209.1 hypothetical protein [Brevibacillus agri]MBY0053207.1 hypothetical protein [Brevibacillus agri]MDN4092629.1 hypothetical protein [Brevibacillus agri]QAV14761.1 hypothetical protein BA6348_19510 [Brevibacillus agri]
MFTNKASELQARKIEAPLFREAEAIRQQKLLKPENCPDSDDDDRDVKKKQIASIVCNLLLFF